MKATWFWLPCVVAIVLSGSPVAAQDVTISFRGTVTSTMNSPFTDIPEGTPFIGSYTFNASAPDSNPMDHGIRGTYESLAISFEGLCPHEVATRSAELLQGPAPD